MAVVTPLNNFLGPEGDTVTVDKQLLNTEYWTRMGGLAATKCVRCMQWWCCVFVLGLEFREVASKGPLDILIRELCKITGVLWILSRVHTLVLSLSLTLCLCVFGLYDQISFSFSPVHTHTHTSSSFKHMMGGGGDCPCRLCPVRNA